MLIKKRLLVVTAIMGLLFVGCSSGNQSTKNSTQNALTKDDITKISNSITDVQAQMDILNDTITEFVDKYQKDDQGVLTEDGNGNTVSTINQRDNEDAAAVAASVSPSPSASPSVAASPAVSKAPSTTKSSSPSSTPEATTSVAPNTKLPSDFSKYRSQAEQIQKEVSNNKDTAIAKYSELKDKIDSVDTILETFEDILENQLRNGTLTVDEYKKAVKELTQIEDILEQAEDTLEQQFDIED